MTLARLVVLVALVCALPAAAQTRKPDLDSESPIQTRALRFAGEQPPYRVFVQYPWLAGDGQQIPVAPINGAIARTVLDWVQQFSMQYARIETDPEWRQRRTPARLEVNYKILKPTSRLLCVIYNRSFNDGRLDEDVVSIRTDVFDLTAFRPLAFSDLVEGDRWLRAVAEKVEAQLKADAQQRGTSLFPSFEVRDWLRDVFRWQFEKTNAVVHFLPGEAAPQSAGRFEVVIPYALLAGAVRRTSPLWPLVPKDDRPPTEERLTPRTR